MEDFTLSHLADLYGLNPHVLPFAFNFPLVPPNTVHSLFSLKSNPLKSQLMKNNESMSTKLQDFQHMYQQYAKSLFENAPHGLIPPGHPMYSRQNSLETLKAENSKLQKENLELKKQLDQTPTKKILKTENPY